MTQQGNVCAHRIDVIDEVVSKHLAGPARGTQQRGHDSQQRRLAAPVSAEESHRLAPSDDEVCASEYPSTAEASRDARQLDGG
jgi:hypothetical protein